MVLIRTGESLEGGKIVSEESSKRECDLQSSRPAACLIECRTYNLSVVTNTTTAMQTRLLKMRPFVTVSWELRSKPSRVEASK